MEKYELDGETYYYINGKFCDSQYCIVDDQTANKLINIKFNQIDYKSLDSDDLLKQIISLKDMGLFLKAKNLIEYGLEKFEGNFPFIRYILPVYTSCCRNLNMHKKGIEVANLFLNSKTESGALFTSLSATYCDLFDYYNAKKYANRAFAILKNMHNKDSLELMSVYQRIKKETGEK